jgi:translation initiation factor eIF-2B subunit epsilon
MGKHKKSDSAAEDVVKQEPELQAVLLADSFTRTFRPISLDRSKVLCPLNNVTLLDYSLEFLAGAGVQEVFCVCTADDVEQHLARCKITGEMKVTCVKDASLTNAGDALRELDKRNLVQSNPFLLMHGDTLTNVDLSAVMEQHKQRHKQDNSAIMTVLFQKVGAHNKLRPPASDLLVGFDPRDKRILVYDDHASNSKINIPCSFFVSHPQVELHDDLLDCGLDVCSPQVLARFSDEFDYRDIRREFVTNTVAEEEEGLQHKLHAHVLEKHHYAARVHDFCSYHCVSRDLLRRWCYPVVPDNLPNGYETSYRYALQRHYLYKEKHHPTKVGPSTLIQGPGMVGSNSHVGRDCNIVGTVIGQNCVIGNEVTMRDSHVWEQVTVEDGATVIQSILAHGVVIKKGATISRGCVVGSGCVIGANVILPEFTRITKSMDTDGDDDMGDGFGAFDDSSDDEDDDSDLEQHQDSIHVCDYDVVGPDGVGRVWKPTVLDVDEDEDDEPHDPLELVKAQSIGYDLSTVYQERAALQQEGDDGLSDDDGGDGGMDADFTSEFDRTLTLASDTASSNVEQHGIMITGRQRGVDVVKELKTICLEHYGPIENLAIEMNSFKFSQNATYCDCTMAAMLALLDKMEIDASMSAGKLVASLKSQLDRWSPLLRKMSIGLDEERSIVNALEMAATDQGPVGETLSREPSFRFLLQTLHEEEVVSEEAILSWAAERREEGDDNPRGKLFRQQPTQDFLEWLEEESEEEDSSEEEESD